MTELASFGARCLVKNVGRELRSRRADLLRRTVVADGRLSTDGRRRRVLLAVRDRGEHCASTSVCEGCPFLSRPDRRCSRSLLCRTKSQAIVSRRSSARPCPPCARFASFGNRCRRFLRRHDARSSRVSARHRRRPPTWPRRFRSRVRGIERSRRRRFETWRRPFRSPRRVPGRSRQPLRTPRGRSRSPIGGVRLRRA